MILLLGIIMVVAGLVDFLIVALVSRSQAASSGGLDGTSPNPALGVLRRTGAITVVVGVVLVIVGLAT
jgi:hypothetical protein